MSAPTPGSYAFKKQVDNSTKLTLNSPTPPSAFIIINNRFLVGFVNGSIYFSGSSAFLPFGHQHSVSKIYYNLSTLALITGDASG